jgi:hypothetical protein
MVGRRLMAGSGLQVGCVAYLLLILLPMARESRRRGRS